MTNTVLSPQALVEHVLVHYDLAPPVSCRLWSRGMTDTYEVSTDDCAGERFMLRVYRRGRRSTPDIGYELDALVHLAGRGIAVSTPVALRGGGYIHCLQAPEGQRQAVLFTYAPGAPNPKSDEQFALLGSALAALHNAADPFVGTRRPLDVQELIDRPVSLVEPLLSHRPGDRRYLLELAGRLRRRVGELAGDRLDTGFCHGDMHGGNCHLDNGTITFFDFDLCGPGWRAYDLAVVRSGTVGDDGQPEDAGWQCFLSGYRSQRSIGGVDLAAIPVFVAVRRLWDCGLFAGLAPEFGYRWVGNSFFDRALTFQRRWERAWSGG